MVSSVTNTPLAFLSQIATVPKVSGSTDTSAAITPAGNASSQNSAASQEVSSLLSGGGYSSEVLSLLQQNSSGSFDPITTLLGGTGTNDALTSAYASLYSEAASASQLATQNNNSSAAAATPNTTGANLVQNLVNSYTQASQAYNQTLLQNAQSVLSANSYPADGAAPLVA